MRFLSTPENTIIILHTETAFAGQTADTSLRLSEAAAIAAALLVPLYIGMCVAVRWLRPSWWWRQSGSPALLESSHDVTDQANALLEL